MKRLASRDQVLPSANRRSFLKGITGTMAVLPALPALAEAGSAHELTRISKTLGTDEAVGESYWRLVKEQFTIKPGLIVLNAANLCPSPHLVREKVFQLTDDLDGDVSFQNRAKFDGLREEARRKLAAYLGAADEEIAIVRNTSEANNLIVAGLQLKPGDEVVVFDQNHPTNNIAWEVRATRAGYAVKRIGSPNPPQSVEEIIKTFLAATSARTKAWAWTDTSNTTGLRLPTRELCRMARERGIYTHVDGAQTFGSLKIDLHQLGCDSYSGSAHKWFLGPKEAGLLFVRKERIAEIWPSVVGVGWGDKVETPLKGARKFETLGQRDDAAVSALGTTADFHNLIGPARIEARIRELTAALKEGCSKIPGAKLRTSVNPELSAGICVVAFEGSDNHKIYEALYARHGIAAAPTGGIRFSPHIYNTLEEINQTISALSRTVKEA
ncbi:MAG TPA: aminotransferase class V-fold PLP-dependent enzyme [Blastocatellia bacterium]|nr:aminotransferase class V-fold PLP-dependent enzyme [Blastocatellia bacterium]